MTLTSHSTSSLDRTSAPRTGSTLVRKTQNSTSKRPVFGVRMVDIAALRADGKLIIGQRKIPTMPQFDQAFSAFARGTLLQSENGVIAIEDLQPGDRVTMSDGSTNKVTWIGSSTFAPSNNGEKTPLTRIMADSFGENRPDSFMSLGPAARLLQTPPHLRGEDDPKRVLTPANAFVDGVNVIEVTPPTPIRLFHLSLERHGALLAGGLEVESYHPGTQPLRDLSHSLRSVFLSLFPHITHVGDFGPLQYSRAPELAEKQALASGMY